MGPSRGGGGGGQLGKMVLKRLITRLNGDYLHRVMEKMRFHSKWIQLIMICVRF